MDLQEFLTAARDADTTEAIMAVTAGAAAVREVLADRLEQAAQDRIEALLSGSDKAIDRADAAIAAASRALDRHDAVTASLFERFQALDRAAGEAAEAARRRELGIIVRKRVAAAEAVDRAAEALGAAVAAFQDTGRELAPFEDLTRMDSMMLRRQSQIRAAISAADFFGAQLIGIAVGPGDRRPLAETEKHSFATYLED